MKMNVLYSLMFAAAVITLFVVTTPLSASEADDKITSSFENTYVKKVFLKDDSVSIAAKDGVVTLTGTVAEESHKEMAHETATNLPGVLRVDNQLATKAEIAAENADYWMGKKVNLNLLFHRHVNAGKTTVEVKDGIVTLKGEASSAAQKELTTEYAQDIKGVKEVKNEMTVATAPAPVEQTVGEKIDDASVTAQVKTALLTHHSTSAVNTKVETRDGVVTLTGIAKNAAEHALVTKIITDIQGVASVKNLMTVEEVKK